MIDKTDDDQKKRPFLHKLLLLLTFGYFIGLAIWAGFIYRASPGPTSQEVLGVGIGHWENETGIAYLSGRHLDCQQTDDIAPYTHLCRVDIAGKPLEIQARRNQPPSLMQLGGICAAFYDQQQWPCEMVSRHLHIHWFAYIDPPLGLESTQMDALRQKYFIENLSEEPFLVGILSTAVTTTLLMVINFLVWFWPTVQKKWVLLITAVPIAMITFFGTFLMGAIITNGFWD